MNCPSGTSCRDWDNCYDSHECEKEVGHLGSHESNEGHWISWTDRYLEWDDEAMDYRSTAGVDAE